MVKNLIMVKIMMFCFICFNLAVIKHFHSFIMRVNFFFQKLKRVTLKI